MIDDNKKQLYQSFPSSVRSGLGMDELKLSVGLVEPMSWDRYNKFARFGYYDPYNTAATVREYLFFTKPSKA
jgi:hypothetical protein